MNDRLKKLDDWMVRISFAESGKPEMGFKMTGIELKTHLALDKIMVIRSEKTDWENQEDKRAMNNSEYQKPSENAREEKTGDENARGEKARGEKLDVMILDDEPIVGKRLKPTLEKGGFNVEVFLNPNEALARLEEKEFDIVVTDLKMEEIDGIQVLENILSRCKHTRVILITGYATVEVAREALVKGAFDFIAKPFKPRDLKAVINKAALSLGHMVVNM